MNTDLTAVQQQLQQLEQRFNQEQAQLQHRLEQSESRFQQAQHRLRVQAELAFAVVVIAILICPANRAALAQSGLTLQELANRVNVLQRSMTAVQSKTQFMSADPVALSTTFSGCNVIVNDGGGSTQSIVTNSAGQGLGNLIIGYNAHGNDQGSGDQRTGSHNLILGDENNYSSYGGLVAGLSNSISGVYCYVCGGNFNTASGVGAAVSGGYLNTASGPYSTVSGGYINTASGSKASISGGYLNLASADDASVSGGTSNTASADDASVSGGYRNTANGDTSSVSGGGENTASGVDSCVSGGYGNTASGEATSVSGGASNTANGLISCVSGGGYQGYQTGIIVNTDYGWAAGGTGAGTFHSP